MRPGINKSEAAAMVHEVVRIQEISARHAEHSQQWNLVDSWATSLEDRIRSVLKVESDEEFTALFRLGKVAFERDFRSKS